MKFKNKLFIAISVSVILILAGYLMSTYFLTNFFSNKNASQIIKPEKPQPDSVVAFKLDSAIQSAEALAKNLSGRKISILITGVDARLGSNSVHADANHLVNIWLDSGKIEILSIPRGTYVDLGYSDTCNINYLANVRSLRGREAYQQAVKEITGIDTINYFVEFGFSQAIGLLELLGHKDNAVQMLRVLRSRKAFGVGDYQRAYNQGQFIRQMLLTHYGLAQSTLGSFLIRGGLYLVESDLTYDAVNNIINILKQKHFPRTADDVIIRLVPKFDYKLFDFNFTNQQQTDSLYRKIAYSAQSDTEITDIKIYNSDKISKRVVLKLNSLIKSAKRDAQKSPLAVIRNLDEPFHQRSWYQISNTLIRDSLKNSICLLLLNAYYRTNQSDKARYVKQVWESEKNNR